MHQNQNIFYTMSGLYSNNYILLLPVCCGNCVNWYVAGDEEFVEEIVRGDAEELFTFVVEEFGIYPP